MKKLLYGAVALAISLSVSAQPMERDGRGAPFMKLLKQLELSEQQKQEVKQILQAGRDDHRLFRADRRDAKQSMRAIIQADSWDQDAALLVINENADLHQQARLNRALTRHQIWLLLDEAQQQQLSQMSNESGDRKARAKQRREGMWQRVSEKLELSEQQLSEIEAIRAQRRDESEAFKTLAKAHREAEKALIRTDTFDQQAWLTLYEQHQDAATTQALSMAYSRHQMAQVLTEEQRQSLEEMTHKVRKRFQIRRQGL